MTTPNFKQNYAQHAVASPLNNSTASRNAPIPRSSGTVPTKAATTAPPQNALSKANMGGAAMTSSLSQMSNASTGSQQGLGVMASTLLGASPSNNLLAFASPGTALLDIATPSVLLDGASTGGQPMNISMSDMGAFSGKRNEDEERRVKLQTVLSRLLSSDKRGFGRLSEESVRRVGRWAGFEEQLEHRKEGKEFEGNRIISVAGKNIVVDFTFSNNLVVNVDITLNTNIQSARANLARAAPILLSDLTPRPGFGAINTKLDRLAADLELIARLDKLGMADQAYGIEAISGVYDSLRKLYEHEKKAAATIINAKTGNTLIRAERHVMCKKSGRPQLHVRGNIGLSLDYWMEKCHIYNSAPPKDESAMDIDSQEQPQQQENAESIYHLEITAEPSSPDIYPSLRVSSAWMSDRIVKPAEETTDANDLISGIQSIDWQDPPPTYVTEPINQGGPNRMSLDAHNPQQKLPPARFIAKLHPPLVTSWQVATSILSTVNSDPGVYIDTTKTYESMLLQKAPLTQAVSETKVILPNGQGITHKNTLAVPKLEYGYVLREIPFTHPRDIVAVLPLLRQWAALGKLLRGTFLHTDEKPLLAQEQQHFSPQVQQYQQQQFSLSELSNPLQDTLLVTDDGSVRVNVTLSTSSISPSLDVVFQGKGKQVMSLCCCILTDGQVSVQDCQFQDADLGNEDRTRIAKALEITQDLGVWVEWVRERYTSIVT